jgi:hypothetical protein
MSEIWSSFKLSDYTTKKVKLAISLVDLVSQTNSFSVKNRPGCVPHLEASDPKDLFLRYNVKCNLETSDPNGHDVKVHFDVSKVTPDMRANDLDIKVNCSCPAFLYWGNQWNLHERDALEGEPRPKLQAPKERLDLRTNALICKHIKAVCERILPAVQHNIQNIVREKVVEEYKQTPTPKVPTRLEREQDAMRQRQLLKKKRRTPKEKEFLEEMQRKERDRLLQEEAELDEQTEREIERTAPAAKVQPTPAEQKEKLKQPQKEEVHVKDEEESHSQNHDLIDQMLVEEKRKLEEQSEGGRKRLKKMRDDKFNNWKKNRNRNQNFRVSSLEEEETEDVAD